MRSDTTSGILFIAGSVTGLAVMALHPTGGELLDAAGPGLSQLAVGVHALAIAAVPALLLGALGLTRRLAPSDLATAAFVVFAVAEVAVLSAGVVSGFVATDMIERIRDAENGDAWRPLLTYSGLLNHAFAKVHVAAAAGAMLLWCAAILRAGRWARAAAIVGGIIAVVTLLGLLGGHLLLDVHGFGLVVLGQAVWMIWIGVLLIAAGRQAKPA